MYCVAQKPPALPLPESKLGLALPGPAHPGLARLGLRRENNGVTYGVSITAVCCCGCAGSVTEYQLLDSAVAL